MQRLVIHAYYLMQILMAVLGLIRIELALSDVVQIMHFELWWGVALKSSLIVSYIITLDSIPELSRTLYLPQFILDGLFLVSRSVVMDWFLLIFGLSQLIYVILKIRREENGQKEADMSRAYRSDWFRYWNRSCIGPFGEAL